MPPIAPPIVSRWTVYSRPDCSLCDQFLLDLAAVLGPVAAADVTVVDVDSDPDLAGKYGQRIPVLMADGEFVCAIRVDIDRVRRYLRL